MNYKKIYTLNAVISVAAGGLIYLLFRPHALFLSWLSLDLPLARLSFFGDIFVRCYLADFLWCYALCFSMFRLHLPSKRNAVFISLCAFLFGCLWELLQYTGLALGTGDCFDCVAYAVGCMAAVCIYFLIKRRKS